MEIIWYQCRTVQRRGRERQQKKKRYFTQKKERRPIVSLVLLWACHWLPLFICIKARFFGICFFYHEIICWFKEKFVFISYFYKVDVFFPALSCWTWIKGGEEETILKNTDSYLKWLQWKSLHLIDDHLCRLNKVASSKTLVVFYNVNKYIYINTFFLMNEYTHTHFYINTILSMNTCTHIIHINKFLPMNIYIVISIGFCQWIRTHIIY